VAEKNVFVQKSQILVEKNFFVQKSQILAENFTREIWQKVSNF